MSFTSIALNNIMLIFDHETRDFAIALVDIVPGAGYVVKDKRPLSKDEKAMLRGYFNIAMRGKNE